MGLSSRDIRDKEFEEVLVRGYSRNDVDEFLTQVIASFDEFEEKLAALSTRRIEMQRQEADRSSDPAQGVRVLAHAQRAADNIIEPAKV